MCTHSHTPSLSHTQKENEQLVGEMEKERASHINKLRDTQGVIQREREALQVCVCVCSA
jgi:hypothetical protein